MATASIIHTQGAKSSGQQITVSPSETLTITVTLRTSTGAARDCSGGTVSLAFGRRGSSRSPLVATAAGEANGVHTITVPRDITATLDKTYEYNTSFSASTGETETLDTPGSIIIEEVVGAAGHNIAGTLSTAPVVQMTSPASGTAIKAGSVTWTFIASSSSALTASNFLAVIDGEPTSDTVTLTSGSGTTNVVGSITATLTAGSEALSVRCTVGTSQTTATARTVSVYPAPSIIITTPGAWVLAGTVNVLFAAASTDVGESFTAGDFSIVVDGEAVPGSTATIDGGSGTGTVTGSFSVSLLGVTAHTVEVVCTDQHGGTTTSPTKTVNTHTAPTAVMGTPAVPSPNPGTSAFAFTATDDAALTSANCVAVVDGADTADVITFSGTAGSYSTTLSTVGAHTLAVRVTDTHNAATTGTAVSVTVAQPTLTLTTPVNSTVKGAQTVAAGGACSPAMPDGTQVRVYAATDGGAAAQIGTATLSNGAWSCTTDSLPVGSHVIDARLTTLAGTVISSTKTVVVYPVPSVTVTLDSGAWLIAGTVVVPFSASTSDVSEVFTAGDFTLSVDGTPVVLTPTILTGTGTNSVTGSFSATLTELVARALVVTCTDRFDGTTASASKTINLHEAPAATMAAPSNATPLPGSSAFTFTASDDGNLTSANCKAVVDGVETLDVVTLTSGPGTPSIAGGFSTTLATAGAHTIAVKITDGHAVAVTSTPVSVTVTQPTLSIVSPATDGVRDVATLALAGACSPALPDGTVITVRDVATVLGTTALSSGAWSYTTGTLTESVHVFTASVTTSAGTVTSNERTITVTDALPVIVSVAPSGTTVAAGPVVVTATVTHAYGRPLLVRAKIDTGAYFDLTLTTGDTYVGTSAAISADGSHNVSVEATDATGWTGGALDTEAASFTISYAVLWNSGVQTFVAAYRDATAPSSGDLLLDLSAAAAGAVNGGVLRVTVPAGCAAYGLRLPTGYAMTSDATIAWVDNSTLDGWEPWVPGIPYVVTYKIDTGNSLIKVSARKDLSTPLGSSARLYRGADTTARTNTGATSTETAVATTTEVVAAYNSSGEISTARRAAWGNVVKQSAANGQWQMPVAGSTAANTIMGWFMLPSSGPGVLALVPNVSSLEGGGAGRAGAAFIPPGSQGLYMVSGMGAPNEPAMPDTVAAAWGTLTNKPAHIAWVNDNLSVRTYVNGLLLCTHTVTALSWSAAVTNGNGMRLFSGGAIWGNTSVWARHVCVGAFAATQAQISAHMAATSPVSAAGAHVVVAGSSLYDRAPTGGGAALAEAIRLAASASTDYWHHYAVSGSPVSTYAGGLIPLQGQIVRAFSDWQARGNVVLLDWGSVLNESSGATSVTLMIEETKRLLGYGWRPMMLDMAAHYTATSGGTEDGATLRSLQEGYYDKFGNSVIRIPVRAILGATWATQSAWYDDDVHFNAAARTAIANYAGPIVAAIIAQTAPLAALSWI